MARSGQTEADREYGARLGRALAAARAGTGLSGGQLSDRCGVSVDAIRSVESGRVASPGFPLVAALGGALGVSLDALALQAADSDHRTARATAAGQTRGRR